MYAPEVTTQTWVIYSNVCVNNERLFECIECAPLKTPLPKHQKRMIVGAQDYDLPAGSIVFAEYLGKYKGQPFRRQKEKQMRNCATIIIKVDKYYNIKISKKGNFQVTGCTSEEPVRAIVYYLWKLMNQHQVWYFHPGSAARHFCSYICCRMFNVRFQLPYHVDLARMNETIKTLVVPLYQKGEFSSAYEPSIGYGGVNVKVVSYLRTVAETEVTRAEWSTDMTYTPAQLGEYLDLLDEKQRQKKSAKISQHSFLVFGSGRVIMSGTFSEVNRADAFQKFCTMVASFRQYFECGALY